VSGTIPRPSAEARSRLPYSFDRPASPAARLACEREAYPTTGEIPVSE